MSDFAISLLIMNGIVFYTGIVSTVISFVLVKKKRHPVIAIILSIIGWFSAEFSLSNVFGPIGMFLMFLMGIYNLTIIIRAVKVLKDNY